MSQATNVSALFQSSHEEGDLSAQSLAVLSGLDLGAKIQAALGTPVGEVEATEVVIVAMLVDDSGSIRFAGNAQAVRDGHNLVIEALTGSKQKDRILIHTRYLNGNYILFPYCLLDGAVKMDQSNYNPMGGTPLYDESVVILGTVIAKVREFADNGVPVRAITLIVTDGHDEGSRKASPGDVKTLVDDMLSTERHIIAAMGVDDGGVMDFREVFKEMGIPDEWILTPGSDPKEIRQAFNTFSQSAVRASQSPASFSKTAAGGFGNP